MSSRASAITAAGIVLSQPTRQTRPSKRCPSVTSSIESAITSREISEARMPEVPIETPSETEIVLNSIGVPPAARIPSFTCFASTRWLKLHGIVSIQVVATPTSGFARSSSVNPTRLQHRAGGRAVDAVGQRGAAALAGIGWLRVDAHAVAPSLARGLGPDASLGRRSRAAGPAPAAAACGGRGRRRRPGAARPRRRPRGPSPTASRPPSPRRAAREAARGAAHPRAGRARAGGRGTPPRAGRRRRPRSRRRAAPPARRQPPPPRG